MHSEDHSFLTRCFTDSGHALLALHKWTWFVCDTIQRTEWICVCFSISLIRNDILKIPPRLSAAVSSLALCPCVIHFLPPDSSFFLCLRPPHHHPPHLSPHLWSPLQLLQHFETGEMCCLATGCSWTNSIPPDELTIMCLNRERTRGRGGGLSSDGERTKRGKEQNGTEQNRYNKQKGRKATERVRVRISWASSSDCAYRLWAQPKQIPCNSMNWTMHTHKWRPHHMTALMRL